MRKSGMIMVLLLISCMLLAEGCVDLEKYRYTNVYSSSSINANFEGNNLNLRNVGTLASQHYSVEDVLPTEGIPLENDNILPSLFDNNSTVYLLKVLVPHDNKIFDDEYPEYLTFFIHQNNAEIAWSAIPQSNSNYPQNFVADIVKLSFNISDKKSDQYAEIFGENITTISIPHQPEVRVIVDYLNEHGDSDIQSLGNGNYLIEFLNDSLPYEYKAAGSIFVHTRYLKIIHSTENARYEIRIDGSGNLTAAIHTSINGVSLEDGKVVLKSMFEDIGLNTELVDEMEFGLAVA